MTKNEEIILEAEKHVMSTYGRQPVAFVKGRGLLLEDADGREYLDFLAGLAVCSLGHSHPAVVGAIQAQAAELIHTSNLYHIPNQVKLARYLSDLSFGDKIFFCNSGTEANEGAIKLARRYQEKVAGKPEKKTVLSFANSFHGRTLGALAATGQAKYHDGFSPLPSGFTTATYNDIESVRKAVKGDATIGAVIVEPVQAEGGVIPAKDEFLRDLRALCDEEGLVLIYDEVQTGIGRCGKLFAYEHSGAAPDAMTLAKGLGGGVPIGALVATGKLAAGFVPGTHASTFGGNPLATAVAIAVLKTILNDQLVERAEAMGRFLMDRILARKPSSVVEVRGRGLLIGIELDRPAAPYVPRMLEKGFVIGTAGEKVIRLAPPLIVSENQCVKLLDTLLPAIA